MSGKISRKTKKILQRYVAKWSDFRVCYQFRSDEVSILDEALAVDLATRDLITLHYQF